MNMLSCLSFDKIISRPEMPVSFEEAETVFSDDFALVIADPVWLDKTASALGIKAFF